jgi:hypothetical protein
MSERSRVPYQWRTPPQRYGKITDDELEILETASLRFKYICIIGCALGAWLALGAAVIAWAEPVAAFVRGIL